MWIIGWVLTAAGFLRNVPWQLWVIAAVVIGAWIGYNHAYNLGKAEVRMEWDAAVARDTAILEQKGKEANARAEQTVPALSAADRAADVAIPARGEPCRVFDANDRSCAGRR